jgi:hypothetical protein
MKHIPQEAKTGSFLRELICTSDSFIRSSSAFGFLKTNSIWSEVQPLCGYNKPSASFTPNRRDCLREKKGIAI